MRDQRRLMVGCALLATLLLGCNVLKKLKKKHQQDDQSFSSPNELNAVNASSVLRFPDEVPLHGALGTLRQTAFVRTGPSDTGSLVEVVSPNTTVLRFAERFGSTLITFDSASAPVRRAGWVTNNAFLFPTIATPPPPPPPPPPPDVGGRCRMELRVAGFTPSKPACVFNEKVRAGSPTTITFDCNGGGTFARFGSQTFAGSASRSRVSLSNTENYPFNKCVYRSVQTITGTPPSLTYTYSESVVSGPCKESSSCTARATVTAF